MSYQIKLSDKLKSVQLIYRWQYFILSNVKSIQKTKTLDFQIFLINEKCILRLVLSAIVRRICSIRNKKEAGCWVALVEVLL